MDAKKALFCTGDPVLDLYAFGSMDGSSFKTDRLVREYGGALNVWKNAEKILSKKNAIYFSPIKSTLAIKLKDLVNLYAVIRYIDEEDNLILEGSFTPTFQKEKFYSARTIDVCNQMSMVAEDFNFEKCGLVLSEYNKGALNKNAKKHRTSDMPKFDFCVVDSRYRTINLDLIESSTTKIWHATNEEYDPDFAENFHYTLHTDAKNRVRILDGSGNIFLENDKRLEVPDTPIVNTCGAGDTFTAAVACFILQDDRKITPDSLANACEFAIRCCQEVIQTRTTTQTTIRLE